MTNLLEWIRSNTVLLGEFLRQIMYVGIAFQLIQWKEEQQMVVLAALSALFALFSSKQTVASNRIDTIVDKAIDRSTKINENITESRSNERTNNGRN